ncbi:hypothetical protein KUTeg_014501 [Tegillarca granosa]|uniref:Tetraspanin n=1 Tax=Tegillarca granosa TaxID=220873 RepID=A0ABQ9EVF9_TEGGR|nr:hypothetical protein KUTeg_014501 [Tegillarca granosa]
MNPVRNICSQNTAKSKLKAMGSDAEVSTVAKVFLIVLNVIFMLFGIAVLVPAILVQIDVGLTKDEIKPLLNNISIGGLSLGNLVDSLSITFICIGVFITIVAGLGAFGACCKNRCLLMIYAIIVLLLFIMQITVIALWFTMRNEFESRVKSELKTQLNSYTNADLSSHEISTSWNYLFIYGCYDAAYNLVTRYSTIFIAIIVIIFVLELLAVIFAISMCRQLGKVDQIV